MSFIDDRAERPSGGDADPRQLSEIVAALSDAETRLAGVDRALEALDRGTYGRCPACDAPIPEADLVADPTVTHCAVHRATVGASTGLGSPAATSG